MVKPAPAPVAVADAFGCVELSSLLEVAADAVVRELPPTPVELEHASVSKVCASAEKVISAH